MTIKYINLPSNCEKMRHLVGDRVTTVVTETEKLRSRLKSVYSFPFDIFLLYFLHPTILIPHVFEAVLLLFHSVPL